MRQFILILGLLLPFLASAQEEIEIKTYSYSEFFQMIEDEEDTVFRLRNALIEFKSMADSSFMFGYEQNNKGQNSYNFWRTDTIHIRKGIILDNVHFRKVITSSNNAANFTHTGLYKVEFHKSFAIRNAIQALIIQSTFNQSMNINITKTTIKRLDYFSYGPSSFDIDFCNFKMGIDIFGGLNEDSSLANDHGIRIFNSKIHATSNLTGGNTISLDGLGSLSLNSNQFIGKNLFLIYTSNLGRTEILGNDFSDTYLELSINKVQDSYFNQIAQNIFNKPLQLTLDFNPDKIMFDWEQLKVGLITTQTFGTKYRPEFNTFFGIDAFNQFMTNDSIYDNYLNKFRIENESVFKEEKKMLGDFYDLYKANHDTRFSNAAYVAMKELDTKRMAYEYKSDPSFDAFFTWKVNQFLKLFSDYGTKPSKSIIFSIYVIFAFALVYLFFPNYWDSYGKKRLKHRFGFFYKYMSLNAGIQEVYLEENKTEIQDNEAFKTLLIEHKEQAPRLFFNLAMPLYRWSVASTVAHAWLIKRFDFLKGTWQDTDPNTKGLKSVLIGTIFIFTLLYDIFIKMLNALMLSINTFTTLGFGEIPIKGLPRYLAIIQGFIGWFMLTIFSVSLISQLLN